MILSKCGRNSICAMPNAPFESMYATSFRPEAYLGRILGNFRTNPLVDVD